MDKYKVWVKSGCPFCQEAKTLLLEKQIPHEIVVLDKDPDLLEEVKEKYNWKTVPIVIKQKPEETEELIGGYTDLVDYLKK